MAANVAVHAAAVLVTTPAEILLVKDPKKPRPHYWKMPGGKMDGVETPLETAVRELEEETGILVEYAALREILRSDRNGHSVFFFRVDLVRAPGIKWVGEEYENIAFFQKNEALALPDLFPPHRPIIRQQLAL